MMNSKPEKLYNWVAVLIAGLIPMLSVIVQQGGAYLHGESAAFLFNYWRDRPLAAKIFDPVPNDWGLYQARELSYFIDYLDAGFIRWSIAHGVPHFYSFSTILVALLTVGIFQIAGTRLFKNIGTGSFLTVNCLLMTLPAIFWGNLFFRSSKPGCALMLVIIGFCLYDFFGKYQNKHCGNHLNRLIITIASAEMVMMLLDRQGMFWVATITVGLGLVSVGMVWMNTWRGAIPMKKLLIGSMLVLALGTIYNLYIAPYLIYCLNGYYPECNYQQVGIMGLLNFSGGLTFVLTNLGGMFGGLGIKTGVGVLVLIAAGLISPYLKRGENPVVKRWALWYICAYVFMMCAMIAAANLMTSQHPAMLYPDVIRGGYFMPNAMIVMFFFVIALNSFLGTWRFDRRVACAILWLMLVGNIFLLRQENPMEPSGHLAGAKIHVHYILYALRHHDFDYQEIPLSLREFNVIAISRGDKLVRHWD